jgi:hypothetical protein
MMVVSVVVAIFGGEFLLFAKRPPAETGMQQDRTKGTPVNASDAA